MMVCKRRDLRKVSDADDLVVGCHALELLAHLERGLAANTSIDFVKEVNANAAAIGDHTTDREHEARKLAAGRNLAQRTSRLAAVGLHDELNRVGSGCGPLRHLFLGSKLD